MNFVKLALDNGGSIHPLILPHQELQGPSLTNPSVNSTMSFELTSDTNLRIKVRGTDGTLRSENITLA